MDPLVRPVPSPRPSYHTTKPPSKTSSLGDRSDHYSTGQDAVLVNLGGQVEPIKCGHRDTEGSRGSHFVFKEWTESSEGLDREGRVSRTRGEGSPSR